MVVLREEREYGNISIRDTLAIRSGEMKREKEYKNYVQERT